MRHQTLFVCFVHLLITPTIKSVEDKDWWQKSVFYQIYPRSFKDSNGDGIGDLNGITSKLEYLKETGIDAVWLSPIFASPMVDFGYDISDYYKIQPEYGNIDDFDALIDKAKLLDIKLILDFVPNRKFCEYFLRSCHFYSIFYHKTRLTNMSGSRSQLIVTPFTRIITFGMMGYQIQMEDKHSHQIIGFQFFMGRHGLIILCDINIICINLRKNNLI